jgi:hypothetical protein
MEKKTTAIKGLAPNLYDGAWEQAEQMVKEDSNLCIVPEIESGFPMVVTLEQRQQMVDSWEATKPKLDWKVKTDGKIVYFGTGGSLDKNIDLNSFWYGE